MKSFLFFLLCVLSIFDTNSIAQNLVPDPGFEITRRLPKRKDNSVSCTKHWQCPMDYGAADYYHKDGKGHGTAPRNIFGRQKPHSGKAYGGMCIRKKFMEELNEIDWWIGKSLKDLKIYVGECTTSMQIE
jgi:hypothetical protein